MPDTPATRRADTRRAATRRAPTPEDLYRLRVPTDPRLSPDGAFVAFTVQTVAPTYDGYRHAIWIAPTDGSHGARQLTLGAKHDTHPRFSPDGETLAFLSDRRSVVEEEPMPAEEAKRREDGVQVHLLPSNGGEARRLTDLPRGVEAFAWSPDGTQLAVLSSSRGANVKDDARLRGKVKPSEPGTPPASDYHYFDRLGYQYNGAGFIVGHEARLWIVDVATGAARLLVETPGGVGDPAWSPDGRRIALTVQRRRDRDLVDRSDIDVVDVRTGARKAITGGPDSLFYTPTWMPDGKSIATLGGRFPANAYRNDVWLFASDGRDARRGGGRNLSGEHDLMPGAGMNSDVTIGEGAHPIPSSDGAWLTFSAPVRGSFELWRIATADGRVEQLTEDRHFVSSYHQVEVAGGGRAGARARIAMIRSTATSAPEVHVLDAGAAAGASGSGASTGARGSAALRPVSHLNDAVMAELELREPIERWTIVDGREIQGWLIPGAGGRGPKPTVTEIHGGPHTLYGWSPMWEFQVLAGHGISVHYTNPRGSEGYGRAFNEANLRDWGPGPMADVLGSIDAIVADRLADPDRLGVTGGSYGGYLTTWIVAHDQRFRAAMTCRSVGDMATLFLTGDISGGDWAKVEFGRTPWEDPAYFHEISPLSYAPNIRTPLLIQHSEKDIRTTIAQAEALFTVLRSLRRPVRLLRVPDETHELTRSGTPFRRVENIVQVRAWFDYFLLKGGRRLPPLPRVRAGK